MAAIIVVGDLPASLRTAEMIDVMVAGANARATRVAPCLAAVDPAPSEDQLAEAKLILIGAVKRWVDAGTGAVSQQSAGPFQMSVDTRQRGGFALWPSEIEGLQEICSAGTDASSKAFSITPTGSSERHADWCAYSLGANYCDCGAILAGYPIFGEPA